MIDDLLDNINLKKKQTIIKNTHSACGIYTLTYRHVNEFMKERKTM